MRAHRSVTHKHSISTCCCRNELEWVEGAKEVGYEVDVIGVGKESKSGDAIALRWGNLHASRNEQKVVVIDGGFQESGQDVVDHIKDHYGTTSVDAVVSTHPDQDHVNGLHVVLDELTVNELWIHKPWEHNQGLAKKLMDGRVDGREHWTAPQRKSRHRG